MAEDRQGTDAVPLTQIGARLQENSAGGSGRHLARKVGESFAWNPADKFKPNPQRPTGWKDKI